MKKLGINKLVLASNNPGKVKEIGVLLEKYNIEVLPANTFPYPEPKETGTTFIENANIKSYYYASKTGLPALSDDSGLEIPSLNGAPGVYSADWAETPNGRDFYLAMDKVEAELNRLNIKTRDVNAAELEKLKCNFTCLLSLCFPDGKTYNFEGKVFGHLTYPYRGEAGFGYDPVFTATGYDRTFAEIDPAEKYKISHRADAFKKLSEFLDNYK